MKTKEILEEIYKYIDPYAIKILKWYIIYSLVRIGIAFGIISLLMFIAYLQIQSLINSIPRVFP